MRRAQLHSRGFWAALAGVALIFVLLSLQVAETAQRGARRIGIDIDEYADRLTVSKIEPDAPAARAGLEVGDDLLSIDAQRLAVIEDYDRVAREFERGRSVRIRVERDARTVDLDVAPGMPSSWWTCLGRATVVLVCLFVGSLGLVVRSGSLRARLLAAVFFLIALEFSLPQGLGIDSFWGVHGPWLFYLVTGLQFALELHLASVLPRPDAWPGRRRGFIAGCYFVGASIAAVGMLTYAFEYAGVESLPWSLDRVDEVIHQIVLPAWAVGMLALLTHAAARAPTRKGRLQAALVLLGVFPWTLYILGGWAWGYPDLIPSTGWGMLLPLLVLFYPVAVFVAISRFQLFDLEVVVRRSLVYSALTTVLVGLFYATLGAGGALFSSLVEPGPRSTWSFAAATLTLGLLFSPIRRAVQLLIDRRFFPEREAMRRRLIALAGELSALGDPARMGLRLTRELRGIFRTCFARVLLVEPHEGRLSPFASSDDIEPRTPGTAKFHVDEAWVSRLERAGRPVIVSAQDTSWPAGLRRPRSPRIAIPLIAQRRLVAVLLLGDKYGGSRYSKEELELLGLFAHHVAVAFDNVRLFRSATYEGLTGLLRREAALDLLDREIERARRHRRPLTVALADIDHFKRINDRFGHLNGDRALQRVAAELSDQTRSTDGVGRYGGEEFLLIFPETELETGSRLSEKLRESIERIELSDDDGRQIPIRVSIGVAELHDSSLSGRDTIPELLAAADLRLYRAKETGRNRVEPGADLSPEPRAKVHPIFSSAG